MVVACLGKSRGLRLVLPMQLTWQSWQLPTVAATQMLTEQM